MTTMLELVAVGERFAVGRRMVGGGMEYLVALSGGRLGLGVRLGEATEWDRAGAEAARRAYNAVELACERDPGLRDPNVLLDRELARRRAAVGQQCREGVRS